MSFRTNNEILSILNDHIIGQPDAKKRLVVALYNHFYTIVQSGKSIPKPNVLLIGPTGSGKTFLMEILAEALKVAFLQINSAQLVPAGYEGMRLKEIFIQLLEQCQGNLERAEHAIVVLDEIDKRNFRHSAHEDIGQMVQQELLKPVVSDKISGIDTTNILFVGTGAFDGLTDIVRKRLNNASLSENLALALVTPSDFQEFGMIPELIGRFPIRLYVEKLSRENFNTLIRSKKNSFLQKKQQLFEEHGFELHLTEDALDAMAELAYSQGLGVRALHSVISDACDGIQAHFEDLFIQGKRRIEITKEVILGTAKPRAVPSNKFNADKSKKVRSGLDELFDRLKAGDSDKNSKPVKAQVSEPISQPFNPSSSSKPDGSTSATQAPFSVQPLPGSESYFTQAERRALQKIIDEYQNPSSHSSSIFSRVRSKVKGGLRKAWESTHPSAIVSRRNVLAVIVAGLSYALIVLFGHRNEPHTITGWFRLISCREEFGIWHCLGLIVAVVRGSFSRYKAEKRVRASVIRTFAAGFIYSGIIFYGSRSEIFSFPPPTILSLPTFLDHALWRSGHVTGWNYLALLVAAVIVLWPLRPHDDDDDGPGVIRWLTGKGPYEVNS